ncbi:fatty acid synthase, putative [Ixodes scapularis]|uniref:Fatty acid synthase, putative n=1 Tax=Ixodes scapularis TaxID=6945 RepID=B7Q6N6_IXOSC|nr:fatty acid synthase, putative [Ixodes scapularis]|eukprot:XP_002403184.1 fatty acid synthase, putative [Ixodes scapularis]
MGCQWNGMARQMMQFDVFANSIRRSHELLVPFGIDLVDLITSDNAKNQTMVSPFVSIAAVQVALVSMLKAVGVQPDGIVERWISSSVPQSRWGEPLARNCSAAYHVNNLLSPVLFREALEHVPKDAIVVEIAPHCLLQAVLRRALGPEVSFCL